MSRTGNAAGPAELMLLFGSVVRRMSDVLALVDALGDLCDGALEDCDLGANAAADHLMCLARLRTDPAPAVRRRLEFWAWRVGGSACFDDGDGRVLLGVCCDRIVSGVAPGTLSGAARELLAPALTPAAPPDRAGPVLRLELGTTEAAGLAYEARTGALFVPSPMAPPAGDLLSLRVEARDGATACGQGVVTQMRHAGQEGPGSPGGFLIELSSPGEPLRRILGTHTTPGAATGQRRGPRYAVRALVTVTAEAGAGALPRNAPVPEILRTATATVDVLSQRGAFVRTPAPAPMGAKVRLTVSMPGGFTLDVSGTVVHRAQDGMGIRFDADQSGDAAIGAALALVATQPRRVLIVDDDALFRKMLGDVLTEQGFQVFSAADGTEGLRTLIDVLLGLDLVVLDVHMPGLNGEQLIQVIREAGGERDLTLVVMSADVDPSLTARLTAAGADVVLSKADGIHRIGEVGVELLLRRLASRRAEMDGAASPAPGLATTRAR